MSSKQQQQQQQCQQHQYKERSTVLRCHERYVNNNYEEETTSNEQHTSNGISRNECWSGGVYEDEDEKESTIIQVDSVDDIIKEMKQVTSRSSLVSSTSTSSIKELSCTGRIVSDEQIEEICNYIKDNESKTNVQKLSFTKNALSPESIKPISSLLNSSTNEIPINELDLSHNEIGSDGVSLLVQPLTQQSQSPPRRQQRHHQSDYYNSDDEDLHTPNDNSGKSTLRKLVLNDNKLGAKSASSISALLRYNSDLEALHIDSNSLGSRGMKAIAGDLKKNTSLKVLSVSNNNLGLKGITTLANKVLNCSCAYDSGDDHRANNSENTIVELNIASNNIGLRGMRELSEKVFLFDRSIRTLNISANNIGIEGARLFQSILQYNFTLMSLNISSNNIGNEGLLALCIGLSSEEAKHHSSLTKLHLDWNQISYDGIVALSNTIRCNNTLQIVTLSHNAIRTDGVSVLLEESLPYNMSLRNIDLSYNHIDDDGAYSISTYLIGKHNSRSDTENTLSINIDHNLYMTEKNGTTFFQRHLQHKANCHQWLDVLCKRIKSNKLEQINLRNTSSGSHKKILGDEEMILLSEALTTNTSVKSLYFGGSRYGGSKTFSLLTSKGIESLSACLEENESLERLYIKDESCIGGDNSLDDELASYDSPTNSSTMIAVGNMLKKNFTIVQLVLIKCNISADGAIVLGDAMQFNKTLEGLVLSENDINDGFAYLLKSILQCNPSLKSLHVQSNNISDWALLSVSSSSNSTQSLEQQQQQERSKISTLLSSLSNLSSPLRPCLLHELRLDSNRISDIGLRSLIMSQNSSVKNFVNNIQWLSLTDNENITNEGRIALKWCLPNNVILRF